MTLGVRNVLGTIALLLLTGGLGLEIAHAKTSGRAGEPGEEVLVVVPARTVARILEGAREKSRGSELPARYRLLEELTLPHGWTARSRA